MGKHAWPALLLISLTACGGAGDRFTHPGAGTSAATTGTARFSLTIPDARTVASHGRKGAYVSASTLSAAITIASTTTGIDLSAGSPNCTNVVGGRACILSAPAPIGLQTVSLLLYSGACTGGPPCVNGGAPLSGATNFMTTVVEGASNVTVPLILGGIPATVDVFANVVAHSSLAVPVIVTAYDAAGNAIVGSGTYSDVTGNTVPLTLTVSAQGSQATLHDGGQSGVAIAIAGPGDSITVALGGGQDVLGIPLTVKSGSTILAAHTSQFLAVSGTLTSTQLASSLSDVPTYFFLSPTDGTQAAGMPSGFTFSLGNASTGQMVGYFDASAELFAFCTVSGTFNEGVTAVDGGLAAGYNAQELIPAAPAGVQFIPKATIDANGPCGTANQLSTGTLARTLGWDPTYGMMLHGDSNDDLYTDTFSSPSFAANTLLAPYAAIPQQISVSGPTRFWLANPATAVFVQHYPAAPASQSIAGTNLTSLTIGPDGRAYILDVAGKTVYAQSATAAPVLYTAGSFSGAISTQLTNLAVGPDGIAYSSDGASAIESLTASGQTRSMSLPAPGGYLGAIKAVFDGHNGYLYAYYEDGVNAGTQYVFRLSN